MRATIIYRWSPAVEDGKDVIISYSDRGLRESIEGMWGCDGGGERIYKYIYNVHRAGGVYGAGGSTYQIYVHI